MSLLTDVPADTGDPESDRLIGRLMASDPDFEDCTQAAKHIREIVPALGAAESRANTAESMWRTQRERAQALQAALSTLLAHVDAGVCLHDETQLRGTIWTNCRQCGCSWETVKGPRPHKDHPAVAAARVVLAGAPNSHVRRYEALRDVQALPIDARLKMMDQAARDAGVGTSQTVTGGQFDAFADALINLLEKAK